MDHLLVAGGLRGVMVFLQKRLSVSEGVLKGLVGDVCEAAAHHSYVETFSCRADSWHRALKFTSVQEWFDGFRDVVAARLPRRLRGPVVLAVDITDEAFYGVPTLETVPWTGEDGITSWWKFITVSVVVSSANKTIPIAALPFHFGTRIEQAVERLLDAAASVLPSIKLVLFDRGFYSAALMQMMQQKGIPYLILVPKNQLVGAIADQCRATMNWAVIPHTIEWNADKTVHHTRTNLVFFPDEKYVWVWATNTNPHHISKLVHTYRVRWRIETLFRVQDEARIKTKSVHAIVRYVTFLLSLLLTALWTTTQQCQPFQRWLAETARLSWLESILVKIRSSH
jgi:hypothetical protein